MAFDPKPVIQEVSSWASSLETGGLVQGTYLFGSLVNHGGDPFNAQTSDLDLICVLRDDDARLAHSRYAKASAIRNRIVELERGLLFALRRSDASKPIVSLNLLTPWEASKSIHKDGVNRLLFLRQFLPLHSSGEALVQLAGHIDDEFHARNEVPLRLLQYVQKQRNHYLRTNVHGEFSTTVHTGEDPLPKDLMRIAAGCASFERDPSRRPDDLDSVDPVEGLEYLTIVLNEARDAGSDVERIRRNVAISRRARGNEAPLTLGDLLLLGELVADRLKSKLLPSQLEKIERAVGRSEGT